MAEGVKVSIIVPIYNRPQSALRKCIESTMAQTLKEIEIILVDDGSTDESGMICDNYANKDARITVIHKKNKGLAAARNSGYRIAKGEWITFLDGDDWIDPITCEAAYELGVKEEVEIVIFGMVQEFKHYKRSFKYFYADGQKFVGDECKQLQCAILDFNANIASAGAKLIRKHILDENCIEHNERLRQGSEGIEFNVRLFENVNCAVFLDKMYYHYRYNPNSISARHDEENHYHVIRCFEEIKRQIEGSRNRTELEKIYYNRFIYVIIAAAITGYFSPANSQSYQEKKQSFRKYLHSHLVKETIENYDPDTLDLKRNLIMFMLKRRWFFAISILAKIRYIQKHA